MDILSNGSTALFIFCFLFLALHPKIKFPIGVDFMLMVGVLSGLGTLVTGAGSYTAAGIIFKVICAMLCLLFTVRAYRQITRAINRHRRSTDI